MLSKSPGTAEVFDQKMRQALDLIHEAFALVGELDVSQENELSDAIDSIETLAQDVTGTYGYQRD
jgi:hypothetical protein